MYYDSYLLKIKFDLDFHLKTLCLVSCCEFLIQVQKNLYKLSNCSPRSVRFGGLTDKGPAYGVLLHIWTFNNASVAFEHQFKSIQRFPMLWGLMTSHPLGHKWHSYIKKFAMGIDYLDILLKISQIKYMKFCCC